MNTDALIPIFYVRDVETATRYYVDKLGFTPAFRYGTYAGLRIGTSEIHLTDPGEPRELAGSGSAYVICDTVDEYFAQTKAAGANLKNEPSDRIYGMRDFAVFDLDGNQLTFGCDNESAGRNSAHVS